MSRGTQPFPLSGLGVTTYNTLNGHLTTCWDGEFTTLQWQVPPNFPRLGSKDQVNWRVESGAHSKVGVPRGSPVCVCVCTGGGLLTLHSPSSGWVSCTGELPWELRVWEGST